VRQRTPPPSSRGPACPPAACTAGDTRDPQGAIHPPLYGHSTFAFDSTADLLDVVEGRTEGNLYLTLRFAAPAFR
jgi:O-acetylhomoserine/O-acetylserine sulfhydrylase-like pyridoxal-dependent enzyme